MDETKELLTAEMVDTIRSAASKLTGYKRRAFQAEVAERYCGGSARRAERVLGWGRAAVETGLGERRTGIRCLDAVHQRGRKKTEERCPQMATTLRQIVEPTAQADPKFQTTLAYTRITARRVREELLQVHSASDVPCRETVGAMLNRAGYALRRVLKAKPQKRSLRRMRSSPTSPQHGNGRETTTPVCESRSTPKPRSRSGISRVVVDHEGPSTRWITTCIPRRCWFPLAYWNCHAAAQTFINCIWSLAARSRPLILSSTPWSCGGGIVVRTTRV